MYDTHHNGRSEKISVKPQRRVGSVSIPPEIKT